MKKFSLFLLISSIVFSPALFPPVSGQTTDQSRESLHLDQETIAKGYTVSAFADNLQISLVPGILASSTRVDSEIISDPMAMPWQLERISPIYQFEFRNKAAYEHAKPFYIRIAYPQGDMRHKQVFFYDKGFDTWRPLPSTDRPNENFIRSLIHLPFARIAVFAYPDTLTSGKASWYKYKNGLFAASPDFPAGSRLRVWNKANSKFVDVVVNDFGPDRRSHPERSIDLDKVAFSRIADTGEGVADVWIEPLQIARDSRKLVMGIPEKGASAQLDTPLKAAVIIDTKSGQTLYAKNASSSWPLASLTKILSVYTYLSLKNDLTRVVRYSNADAEMNYAYCKPWESAKLNVPDGEEMTVKDLVYVSLVGSANNTVETLVRDSGLSRVDFTKKMNEIAKGWGASSSKFVEATGLAPENVVSAQDYAIIAKKALENPTVRAASITKKYVFTTITKKIEKTIKNTNVLVNSSRYELSASKTGYLEESLYNLMSEAKSPKGGSVIVVTYGAETRDISFAETEKLIGYGLRMLTKLPLRLSE